MPNGVDGTQPKVATKAETAAQRALSRAKRGEPQEVEGTEGGEPVVTESLKPQEIIGTAGGEPVMVEFEDGDGPPRKARLVKQSTKQSLAPTTTQEDDRVTQGQRTTSLLWEIVQAVIAFAVTGTTVYVLAALALNPREPTSNQLQVIGHLMVMTTMILTFYYQRTNHTRIGGVGPKANEPYRGR